MKYILQAFTGIEERLAKLEESTTNQENNKIGESSEPTEANIFQLNMILGSSFPIILIICPKFTYPVMILKAFKARWVTN